MLGVMQAQLISLETADGLFRLADDNQIGMMCTVLSGPVELDMTNTRHNVNHTKEMVLVRDTAGRRGWIPMELLRFPES